MAASIFYPLETIEEILQRLPVKTLCRFKCVSKQWKTLISSNQFIKTHLDHSNRLHLEKLILVSDNQSLYSVDLVDLRNVAVSVVKATELRHLPPLNGDIGLNGSCNGLALASNGNDRSTIVLNTTSGECMEVDSMIDELGSDIDDLEVLGLGYDSLTDDYKIVMIASWDIKDKGRLRLAPIFSLRSNRLRKDIKPPDDYALCTPMIAVYLNGCLHWLCKRVSDSFWFIGGFNLKKEFFLEMGLPSFVNNRNGFELVDKLILLSGCLCFVGCWDENLTELWVMKDYGLRESWKKISIYGLGTLNVQPLWLLGNWEVVLVVDMDEVVVYNVEEKIRRAVMISGVPGCFEIAGTWLETLVSPKYRNGPE